MIDIENDTLVPVPDLVEEKTGRRPSPQLAWRWRTKGCNGVRLSCVRIGQTWYTTAEAFAEFTRAQSGDCNSGGPVTPAHDREHSMRRRLKAAGLL
jgi:hypothetical protein